MDWDELEGQAEREDKERGNLDQPDERERPKKKKGSGGSAPPSKKQKR